MTFRLLRGLLGASVLVGSLTVTPTAGAATDPMSQTNPVSQTDPVPRSDPALQPDGLAALAAVPPPGVGLSPEVALVPASSPELDAAEATLGDLERRRDDQTRRLARDRGRLVADRAELEAVSSLAERRSAQVTKAERAERRSAAALGALTTDRFIEGDHLLEGLDPALTAERRRDLELQIVLGRAASERLVQDRRHQAARVAELREDRDALRARAAELRARADDLTSSAEELASSLAGLEPRIVDAERRRDEARRSATIDGTDMSATALDAYWRAQQLHALFDPDCGVTWSVLAGIGRTESLHGTYRGAELGVDGMVAPPIYGPDLDGSNDFAVVPDSDGGELDGTARTDRAVGPMQFLPGTWRAVEVDLDGNGVADPQNLFDAAATAGAYLCRSGPGLGDRATLRDALLTYNRSIAYVDIVEERALDYAAAVGLG